MCTMADGRMELFIETLTGTAFELTCSPLETIESIKAKIQYSEGIPVSQQHLIWKSQELNDDLCLQDYCINDGATLKLVLGMRGGPINTRQVSDTRKLKDIAEYVERSSETAGSSGRPFTVLVFHDGDKVHMYTLMERGECAASPLSGTISETSSVASIKNVEELDQDTARENEVTRGKIAQLQEQLRALNINRSKKLPAPASQPNPFSLEQTPSVAAHRDFHLPPLQRVDAFDSQPNQYSHKTAQAKLLPKCSPDQDPISQLTASDEEPDTSVPTPSSPIHNPSTAYDYIVSTMAAYVLDSRGIGEPTATNFLPPLSATERATRQKLPRSRRVVAVDMSAPCVDSIVKYDPSSMRKQLPVTSSQVLSSRRFGDLEGWLQTRPKTSPDKTTPKTKGRVKRRLRHAAENNPLTVGLLTEEKSSLIVRMLSDDRDVDFDVGGEGKEGGSKNDVGSLVTGENKGVKSFSLQASKDSDVLSVNTKVSPRPSEDPIRPYSAKKLPLIKTKKRKSYKRCSLCSKKTGLATSYTCRCGKNFCATHRYAEVHHCSYDYKTEGRRLLQLNNPVVTASKLPKI